jgi:hypothetical protein
VRSPSSSALAAAFVLALVLGAVGGTPAAAEDYGAYHDFAEVEAQLRAWASRPEVELRSIGTSAGGRTLHVVRIAGSGPVDPDRRPAIFVGANIAGFHNAGTEAALHLVEHLLTPEAADRIAATTFYVAPVLDPDAHDGLFAPVRRKLSGNATKIDHDRDGLSGEDGPNDLDGNGWIGRMRIADSTGGWLPHPEEPRLMVRADADKGRIGAYRLVDEGADDDRDGEYNEDPGTGVAPDKNFAHQFPYPEPDAGPWPSYAPESKAVMDFLLERRNVAAAVVFGPANNLLETPRSLGGGGDLGTQTFTLEEGIAGFLGLDPDTEYTLDQVWEVVKDLPMVRQNGVTKEQLAQFLGAGPATKMEDEDLAVLSRLEDTYKELLEEAGLAADRPAQQYAGGGFTPWLYYQYGTMALELDVWGVPKPEKEEAEEGEEDPDAPMTTEAFAELSVDEAIALGEEKLDAFLREQGVPERFTGEMVIQGLESGRMTPEQMVAMMAQMGGGGGGGGEGDEAEDDAPTKRAREVLAWVDAQMPEHSATWTQVTLPDGTTAEVGGLDPFATLAPPMAVLEPALGVHAELVAGLADDLARVEIVEASARSLGGGVARVRAVARNTGKMATHTALDRRMRTHLPVILEIVTGSAGGGVELVANRPTATANRLPGVTGTLEGEWLVRAAPGDRITLRVTSDNAGTDETTVTVTEETAR